jgi:hypothetical protein
MMERVIAEASEQMMPIVDQESMEEESSQSQRWTRRIGLWPVGPVRLNDSGASLTDAGAARLGQSIPH